MGLGSVAIETLILSLPHIDALSHASYYTLSENHEYNGFTRVETSIGFAISFASSEDLFRGEGVEP